MARRRAGVRLLGALLTLLGAWGLIAPLVDEALNLAVNTTTSVEVVDHVIPAAILLALALPFTILGVVAPLPSRPRVGLGITTVAGVWMTGTHVPLLMQASEGSAKVSAALFHSSPGVLIFVVGIAAVAAWPSDASAGGG